jgi:CRP/FNR family transcriptional regulator, cyclic AMP receptor protein
VLYEALGYVAAGLVFIAFWMKVPIRFRAVSIGASILCVVYAALVQQIPLLILSVALVPLNIVRLLELRRVTAKIKRALVSDLSMDWLRPMMQRKSVPAGEVLFRQGDEQGDIYLVVSGTIRLIELDVTVGAGELIGEMAVFSPSMRRTLSARCETPVELLVMHNSAFLKRYYQNPDFGVYLVRLVERRLLQNIDLIRQIGVERAAQVERLRRLAKIDETTGLGDGDAIKTRLAAEWSRASRTSSPLTVLTIQVHGAAVGDVEIAQVGAALSWCLSRASDFLGRDGNEFVAILPDTDNIGAAALSSEVHDALVALVMSCQFRLATATELPQRGSEPSKLLEQARGTNVARPQRVG